jgi:hypothetical protein
MNIYTMMAIDSALEASLLYFETFNLIFILLYLLILKK